MNETECSKTIDRRYFNQWVAGSNPARLTTEIRYVDGQEKDLRLYLGSFFSVDTKL